MTFRFDAVILAGGRAARLGGTPKPGVLLDGAPLLTHALGAVRDAAAVAVVGPPELAAHGAPDRRPARQPAAGSAVRTADPAADRRTRGRGPGGAQPQVVVVQEEPAFGGPVAGIEAGVRALERPGAPGVVVLLAVDVPGAGPAIPALLRALDEGGIDDGGIDGACLFRDGHRQTLVSALRRAPLRAALETVAREAGSVRDQPVRRLFAALRVADVPDRDGLSADVDTWDDLARLEAARSRRTIMTDAATAARAAEDPEVLLSAWVRALEATLDLPAGSVPVLPVLDLTRDCARNVARPAGPVASYAAGYAQALADVAAGAVPVSPSADGADAAPDAIAKAATLARGWAAEGVPPEGR